MSVQTEQDVERETGQPNSKRVERRALGGRDLEVFTVLLIL